MKEWQTYKNTGRKTQVQNKLKKDIKERKLESLYIAGGSIKWCSTCGKYFGSASES